MKPSVRLATALLLLGATATASAHPGHDSGTLFAGLAHPLGIDHLLAALAVGVWSSAALPAGRRIAGPLVFLIGLLAGAMAAAAFALPMSWVEMAIAGSVALLGAMLFAPRALAWPLGMAVIAAASVLHGLAHGEAALAGSFAAFAAGFLATTSLLHGIGLLAGGAMLNARQWLWRAVSAAFTLAGVLMLAPA